MKKIITFILCLTMVSLSGLMFVSCKKDKDVIRLNEVTHSVFYAPLYAAINLGYMEEEGIKIELENGREPQPVLVDLSEQVVAQWKKILLKLGGFYFETSYKVSWY